MHSYSGADAPRGSTPRRPTRRLLASLCLLLAGGISLAACGGSSPAATATPTTGAAAAVASPTGDAAPDGALPTAAGGTTPAADVTAQTSGSTATPDAGGTPPAALTPRPKATQSVDRSQPAAVINGEPITFERLDTELENRYGKQALDELITSTVIEQEARARKVTASEAEVDAELAKVRKQTEARGEDLEQALASQLQITLAQFRDQLRTRLLVEKLLGSKLDATEQELKTYYEANQPQFATPQEFKLQRVVTDDQPQAAAAAKELRANAKIGTVVQKRGSKQDARAQQNGETGFVQVQTLSPEVAQAVGALAKGQVSEPIPLADGGFAVVKVVDVRGGDAPPIARVREQVEDAVRAEKLQQQANAYIGGLRAKAKITNQLGLPNVQPVPETPPEAPAAPAEGTPEVPAALQTPQG